MRPIATRDDLIELAIKFAPTTACANIIRKEGATNLGGFKSADDKGQSYIIRAESRQTKRRWFIQIFVDDDSRGYRVGYPEGLADAWFIGTKGGTRLIDGD